MADLKQLEVALMNAHKAGDEAGARVLAREIQRMRAVQQEPANNVPIWTQQGELLEPQAPQPKRELSPGEIAVGAAETALTTLTGMTSGALGYAGGAIRGLGNQFLGDATAEQARQSAEQGAEMLTYAPRTEAGQRMTQVAGEAAALLPPVIAGVTPLQAQGAANAARATATAARGLPEMMPQRQPDSVGGLSVGAAETSGGIEAQRRERAASLPVEMKLTKGQATQDFEQQQFERETAKRPEEGAPIRDFMNDQLRRAAMNMDAFIDETGTQLPDTAFRLKTGEKIDEALRKRAVADKARIRVAYKDAEKAGETNDPVSLSSVADYLNENRAEAGLAPIMQAVAKQIEVQGVGGGSLLDGTLQIGEMTLNQAERLRKSINKFSRGADANNLRVAGELKQLIDQSTEGAGGQKYQTARKLRKQYADNYERTEIIKNILGNKRGSNDRRIALEDIVDKSVMNGSVEDLTQVRRLLQTQGAEGMAAWKELQAATLRSIKEEATSNIGQTPDGMPTVSPAKLNRAVMRLDENGKLDKIFGKKGAERLKDLNSTVKDAFVAQPNAVNSSNTSSAIFAAIDMITTASTGVPTPILSALKYGKDAARKRAIEKKVQESLK
jgi:hypothetical protein